MKDLDLDSAPDLARLDPKGLIREAFAIDDITMSECRSIFLDWALSLPAGIEADKALARLLDHYAPKAADGNAAHPMVRLMVLGAYRPAEKARRRGGARARRDNTPEDLDPRG